MVLRLSRAFGDEAVRILKAQHKGMAIYPGALEWASTPPLP